MVVPLRSVRCWHAHLSLECKKLNCGSIDLVMEWGKEIPSRNVPGWIAYKGFHSFKLNINTEKDVLFQLKDSKHPIWRHTEFTETNFWCLGRGSKSSRHRAKLHEREMTWLWTYFCFLLFDSCPILNSFNSVHILTDYFSAAFQLEHVDIWIHEYTFTFTSAC